LPRRGLSINQRAVITSVLGLAVIAAIVPTLALARRPVLGAPLRRPQGASAGHVQRLEADRQPAPTQCGSTAFIDYAEGARGKQTPRAAVRAYRPHAQDLRVQSLQSDRAVVEEFDGAMKIATYEVFRMAQAGWLVVQADTYEPCSPPQ
jgi:hypothetical protein